MGDVVRVLWERRTSDWVNAVAISADGDYVVAGSDDRWVHFLSHSGQVLRKHETGSEVHGVAISGDGEFVAGGSWDDCVHALTRNGQLLWKYQAGDDVNAVAISADGEYVVAGSDDGCVHALSRSGQLLWRYRAGELVMAVAISGDGELVVGGSWDDCVHALTRNGQLLWKYQAGDDVNAVAISADGEYVVAGSDDGCVHVLSRNGQLLWKFEADSGVSAVAINADGEYVLAGFDDGWVYLLDRRGRSLWQQELDLPVTGIAVTPNGAHFVVGGWDEHVRLFENLLSPKEARGTAIATPDGVSVARRIRQGYIVNPYYGLGLWLEEFDRHLAQGHLQVCEFLLKEAREQEYPFAPEEWRYVDSREGILWLRRGAAHHENKEYPNAETCYRRSLEIQQRVGHRAAEGQAEVALDVLDQERSTGRRDPFLTNIREELTVLGDAATVLSGRLDHASDPEKAKIFMAAVELRMVEPLLRGLDGGNERASMLAAASLAQLVNVDQQGAWLTAVNKQNWFTRWRAAEALGEERDSPDSVVPALADALERECDPEVRRALALSLGKMHDPRATMALIAALADTDVDVRWAAVTAVGMCGDRRAILSLRTATGGSDYLGRNIKEAAQQAIQKVEERHPLPTVRACRTCRLTQDGQGVQYATVFWPNETVFMVADIAGAKPSTLLRVRANDSQGTPVCEREGLYATLHAEGGKVRGELRAKHGQKVASERLVELIDKLTHDSHEEGPSHFEVGMRVRCIRDGASDRRELRAGDTGTVRAMGEYRPPIGVEWDRDVAGHDGRGEFTCARGHGWYVARHEVEPISSGEWIRGVTEASLILRILPPQSGSWRPGGYSVTLNVYDAQSGVDERVAEARLRVLSRVEVMDVVLSLGADSAGHPAHPTLVILPDSPPVHCCTRLADSPIGVRIEAVLVGCDKGVIAQYATETEKEGEQWIILPLTPRLWEPGAHSVSIRVSGETLRTVDFSVLDRVLIKGISVCQAVDPPQRAITPATVFAPDDESIYCSVALSEAPPLTRLGARWIFIGARRELIQQATAVLDVAGAQHVAFSLTRPRQGWPRGRYEVDVAVLPSGVFGLAPDATSERAVTPDAAGGWHKAEFEVR